MKKERNAAPRYICLPKEDIQFLQATLNIRIKQLGNILNEKLAPGLKPIYRKEYNKANKVYQKIAHY
jgi:hypothetical protein